MTGLCDTLAMVWAFLVTGGVFLALGYVLACSVRRWIRGEKS